MSSTREANAGPTPPVRAIRFSADWGQIKAWALANLSQLVTEETGTVLRHGRAPCPLHGGMALNFSVTDGKGWHCHSQCATGGDGVDFLRLLRWPHLDEREGRIAAMRELAPRAGVTLEPWTGGGPMRPHAISPVPRPPVPVAPPSPGDVRRAVALAELAMLRDAGCSPSAPPAIYGAVLEALTLGERGAGYLAGRGFDPATAEGYGFRAVGDGAGWRQLAEVLAESFLESELTLAGLSDFPWRGTTPALVIPYRSRGEVVGLRFRNLAPECDHGARYRDLDGTRPPLPFNAVALDEPPGEIHVVEGELNAYTLATHGLRAIGLPGAGAPARHLREWGPLLSSAVATDGRLVAWYDADPAGEKGRARLAARLQAVCGRAWLDRHWWHTDMSGGDVNDFHLTGVLHGFIQRSAWRD